MNNQKGLISTTILILSLVLVVVIIGGAVYLDSTDGWNKLGLNFKSTNESKEDLPPTKDNAEEQGQKIAFVPYQSPDQLYQLQIPDFWVAEERVDTAIFYSYDPAKGQPEQWAKIEIGRAANPDMLTIADWLAEQEIDVTTTQQAVFGSISGVMTLQDNTELNPGDIKSVIYMPVNDQVLIVTSESFGGTRDVAVQFFNAILNSWQWLDEAVSADGQAIQNTEQVSSSENVDGQTGAESTNVDQLPKETMVNDTSTAQGGGGTSLEEPLE